MATIDESLAKYPFLSRARQVLTEMPLEDRNLPRHEILDQARYRIERAVRNADNDIQALKEWPQYHDFASRARRTDVNSGLVEFYSFFVAVQASSKDSFMTTALGKSEAQRSKSFFVKEKTEDALRIFHEATDLTLTRKDERLYTLPVETYLSFGSKHSLFENQKWRLGRLPLEKGIINLSQNLILDLFASVVYSLMVTGTQALRRQPVPADVLMLVRQLEPYVPRKEVGSRANYGYIEEVLKHRVSDGRHRLSWLVLAPYLVNIKGMDENTATEAILEYIGDTRYRQFVRYQVRRAVRQGLLPPSLSSLKARHGDLFNILEKEALVTK